MDKKFDIILSNPPYAQTLYLKFLEKELDIANNVISINPSALIKRDSKHFDSYKKKFDPYLSEIEELDSKIFEGTSQQSVCIMVFKNNKEDLHIKYIDGNEEIISGILEKDNSGFTDYEKEIVKYLYNEHPNLVNGDFRINGKSVKGNPEGINKYVNKVLSKLPDNKAYLICNAANGNLSGNWAHKYFSSRVGQIFDNKEDLREFLINRGGVRNHYLYFNSYNAAKNCKSAMERPLLRFSLTRTQTNQHLSIYHYKYIPNIDWSNIKSDYDILKACNCPENKIKEYIQYVTDIINTKDKGSK